jgi:hypothetical protein
MKPTVLSITSILLTLLLALACRKEKPAFDLSDKDPCSCATEVSAEFDMYQSLIDYGNNNYSQYIDILTDTIFSGATGFIAKEENADSYKWYIGSQTFDTRQTGRAFPSDLGGQDIPITLVVRKTPNKTFYPDDDGYDSITKMLHISIYPILDEPVVTPTTYYRNVQFGSTEGTYRLKGDHLPDSIDMNINVCISNINLYYVEFMNIDGMGTNCNTSGRVFNNSMYRYINFGFGNGISTEFCRNWAGTIHNRIDGLAEISLQYREPTPDGTVRTWYYYKGRKL